MMITWLTWLLVWVKLGLLDVTSPGDIPVEGGIPVLLGSPFFSWVNFNLLKSVDPCPKKKHVEMC